VTHLELSEHICKINPICASLTTYENVIMPSLPRITTRIDSTTQDILLQASAISGVSSLNSFVLNAAIEKAKKILSDEQALKLSQRDAIALTEALDSEAICHSRLHKAAQHYKIKEQECD